MIKQVQLQWVTSKSQGYREGCWSKIIVWLTAWKNLLDSQTHSYNKADFMVSWTKRSCPFLTMPTQKSLKQLLAFLNLYQHLKNLPTPSVHSWDTVSFRILQPDWPHPFLTTPTQNIFDQLLIYVKLYQHAKNQVISFISSGDMID